MHPHFRRPTAQPRVPIHFVTPATWPDIRAGLDAPARAFADAAGFEPRPGGICCCRHPTAASPASCSGSMRDDNPARDPFLPGRLPGLLPNGTYRFVDPPGDARLAALAFALGAYQFARYRKPRRQGRAPRSPGRGRRRGPVAHRRGRLPGPRSHQHAGQRHGPGRARGGGARSSRSGTAPRSASIVGDDLLAQNFPADPCGRPRRQAARRA